MSDYQPAAGSAAHKVIEHLQQHGGPILQSEVAEQFGVKHVSVPALMKLSVEAGLLVAEKVPAAERGREWQYTLPEAPAQADPNAKLDLVHYGDGEIAFSGHRVTEDGAVMLSTQQLLQLFDFATRPPVPDLAGRFAIKVPTFKEATHG